MKRENNQIFCADLQELQEKCDTLHVVLREHKEALHLTNQDVAETIKIPADRARKIFAGELKNPNVFDVMAMCIHFGLSLDALLGNPHGHTGGKDTAIAQLEHENEVLKLKLEHEKENVQHTKSELVRADRSLKRTTTFIYILIGLCSVMVIALANYFGIDLANRDIGFVRDDYVLPMAFVVVAVIVGGVAMLIALLVGLFKEKKAKGEDTK